MLEIGHLERVSGYSARSHTKCSICGIKYKNNEWIKLVDRITTPNPNAGKKKKAGYGYFSYYTHEPKNFHKLIWAHKGCAEAFGYTPSPQLTENLAKPLTRFEKLEKFANENAGKVIANSSNMIVGYTKILNYLIVYVADAKGAYMTGQQVTNSYNPTFVVDIAKLPNHSKKHFNHMSFSGTIKTIGFENFADIWETLGKHIVKYRKAMKSMTILMGNVQKALELHNGSDAFVRSCMLEIN